MKPRRPSWARRSWANRCQVSRPVPRATPTRSSPPMITIPVPTRNAGNPSPFGPTKNGKGSAGPWAGRNGQGRNGSPTAKPARPTSGSWMETSRIGPGGKPPARQPNCCRNMAWRPCRSGTSSCSTRTPTGKSGRPTSRWNIPIWGPNGSMGCPGSSPRRQGKSGRRPHFWESTTNTSCAAF